MYHSKILNMVKNSSFFWEFSAVKEWYNAYATVVVWSPLQRTATKSAVSGREMLTDLGVTATLSGARSEKLQKKSQLIKCLWRTIWNFNILMINDFNVGIKI